ncbi:hypothetical protein AQJ66_36040 [Streptomyces bungoensis]|uniref:Uncharacterized protein n=1 Tax=Streptomyces bungoensis TaxID=285568 RepID=A0A101SJV0_9ACTN|nr:hypothetical protein [Streptomyces bungoensis]KUN75340.1 hypothetical protein AQJ66_36040 [Streptomyces bungoensis]
MRGSAIRAGDGLFWAPYGGDVRMPADARDTGYHRRGRHLWLTADREVAYVRTARGVEAWPGVRREVGCD